MNYIAENLFHTQEIARKTMFCQAPGHSRSKNTPMVESKSSKLNCVLGATTRKKEPTFSKLGLRQWSTVRIVMVLAAKLDLISVQCDITAAFLRARVPDKEKIYVHHSHGFKRGNSNDVLCLKQTLYGLKQAPRYFFKCFTERLI